MMKQFRVQAALSFALVLLTTFPFRYFELEERNRESETRERIQSMILDSISDSGFYLFFMPVACVERDRLQMSRNHVLTPGMKS
jgi:hypothetical protein